MKPYKSNVIYSFFFTILAKKSFGKFEDGNKIYFEDMEKYFGQNELFKQKKMTFMKDIVPAIRVRIIFLIQEIMSSFI